MRDESNLASGHPRVLLVEDNDSDVELCKLAFAAVAPSVDLHCVRDGEQCMAALQNSNVSQLPHLILLDLQMPRMSGLEVLKALAHNDAYKTIPVVVLTTSDAPEDIDSAYAAGCNSYLLKPFGYNAFMQLVRNLTQYWFGPASCLPTPCRRDKPNLVESHNAFGKLAT